MLALNHQPLLRTPGSVKPLFTEAECGARLCYGYFKNKDDSVIAKEVGLLCSGSELGRKGVCAAGIAELAGLQRTELPREDAQVVAQASQETYGKL